MYFLFFCSFVTQKMRTFAAKFEIIDLKYNGKSNIDR